MGNKQSDQNEDKAYDVIKWIPGLNVPYGFVRAITYAAKGDTKRAGLSATSAAGAGVGYAIGGGFAGAGGALAAGALGGGVAEGVSIPIKGKLFSVRFSNSFNFDSCP